MAYFAPDCLIVQSNKLIIDFQHAHFNSRQATVHSLPHCWKAPLGPFVKLNFDARICNDQNCISMGVVIRDSVGTFLAGYAKRAPLVYDA